MVLSFDGAAVDTVSGLIQLAVAPVFLIAGVAGILGVLSGRLARITDRIERLNSKILKAGDEQSFNRRASDLSGERVDAMKLQRSYLHIRARNINIAILFCVLTGLMVAAVIMTMFLSSFLEFKGGMVIAFMFIAGMGFFMISLILFIREIFMATYFMQRTQEKIGVE